MTTTYRTKRDDVLDWVCWRFYGTTIGTVEAVLGANRGLADHGPMLPANLLIVMPDITTPATAQTVRLWD